jgi:hypothetical protein
MDAPRSESCGFETAFYAGSWIWSSENSMLLSTWVNKQGECLLVVPGLFDSGGALVRRLWIRA